MIPLIQQVHLRSIVDTTHTRVEQAVEAAENSASAVPTDAGMLGRVKPSLANLGTPSIATIHTSKSVDSDLPSLRAISANTWQAGHWNINTWQNRGQEGSFLAANVRSVGNDVLLALNPQGEAQIQTTDSQIEGLVEFDMTLPSTIVSGQDVAFFLYASNGDELDVEFLHDKLWLCIHNQGKQYPKAVKGDFFGKRIRGSITWRPRNGVGIELKSDGLDKVSWTVAEADLTAHGMTTPAHPMQAFFSNGAFQNSNWAGRYTPVNAEYLLTVHGYRFSQR